MEMSSPQVKTSYRNVRIFFIVTLAITLCYPAVIDTAAMVRSEKLLQRILLRDSNARIPRATENNDENDASKRICHNAPCGWLVYSPYTRNVDYFMKNTYLMTDAMQKLIVKSKDAK